MTCKAKNKKLTNTFWVVVSDLEVSKASMESQLSTYDCSISIIKVISAYITPDVKVQYGHCTPVVTV